MKHPRDSFSLVLPKEILTLGQKTRIMGILNLTPDSFSHDGRLGRENDPLKNAAYARELVNQGADILDVGGESTRPGAEAVPADEEIKRIIPTIKKLTKTLTVPISVDTYKPVVAQAALDAGCSVVNNIMGTPANHALLKMISRYDAAVVLMHIRGTPRTMQKNISYTHLLDEITQELEQSIRNCLDMGIKSDKIIIDPGIGFGKTAQDNLEIIRHLEYFQKLQQPILIGPSRKSFIGKILNTDVQKRLYGTLAAVTTAILHGAHIVRVHDVRAVKEAAAITDAIIQERQQCRFSSGKEFNPLLKY